MAKEYIQWFDDDELSIEFSDIPRVCIRYILPTATEQEKKSLQFRRSLYIVEDMKAGDIITEKNLRSIRPGLGLPPKYYDMLLGKSVKVNVERGTAVSWDMV